MSAHLMVNGVEYELHTNEAIDSVRNRLVLAIENGENADVQVVLEDRTALMVTIVGSNVATFAVFARQGPTPLVATT